MPQTIETFGANLLSWEDLDPIYTALVRSGMEPAALRRWLLVYSCCYHAGVASYVTDQYDGNSNNFWASLFDWAENTVERPPPTGLADRWPRGSERRHSRGLIAKVMVRELYKRYKERPEDFIEACVAPSVAEVSKRVRAHYNYGPWIAFKIADLIDRVLGKPVNFDAASIFLFDSPREAAEMVYWESACTEAPEPDAAALAHVMSDLVKHFNDAGYLAPPQLDRPIGNAEVETILCKWKSHVGGHYDVGHDILEIREGLEPWLAHSRTAVQFLSALPPNVPKGQS